MAKVAFIGLGVMGSPMARHLSQKGHDVTVYNRSEQKAAAWVQMYGGRQAMTPAEAAMDQTIVFCCVGNDDDLMSVTLGENGAFQSMRAGAIFVDHTTSSANAARELSEKALRGSVLFVDAPVSGGQAGAENGVLTVMCGGEDKPYRQVEPVIMSYARACSLMGPVGSGQLTKMVNQICIAGIVQGLAEGIHFGQKAGLDINAVLDIISKGAAGSWQMDNRGRTMNDGIFDFGFAVDWMRKDLGICLAEARRNAASLPLTALIDQFYGDVQRVGGGRWDTSSLLSRLQ